MKSAAAIFSFLIFAALFGFFIWSFEVRGARILVRQHRAGSFSVARGMILAGQVVAIHGSKGSISYHPSFRYEYEVGGRGYVGTRYRYDSRPSFSEAAPADRIVRAHPIGSDIEVYYDPANPHDAVLSPEVEGFDLGILLIGFPLCLVMLYGMAEFARQIALPGRVAPVAGGVKIISEKMTIRVRLPKYHPLSCGLYAAGVLSFISGLVMSLVAHMTLQIAEMIVLLIVLAGSAIYFWLWKKISAGTQDLIIDEAARKIQLPLTYKRRERLQYAFSDVTGVHLQKVAHARKYGVSYTYAPALVIAGQSPQRLTDLSKGRAESFAAWLREKLGLPAGAGA